MNLTASPTVRIESAASSGISTPELFFECHDQFDGVERVSAQIVDKACAFRNLFGIDAKMINNNFLYAFCYVAHVGFSTFVFLNDAVLTSVPY